MNVVFRIIQENIYAKPGDAMGISHEYIIPNHFNCKLKCFIISTFKKRIRYE